MDFEAFFKMGGYAQYVWPCIGLALAVLIGNLIQPWLQHRRLRRELRRESQIAARLSNANPAEGQAL